MSYKTIKIEKQESFAVVTIDRPPANAINVELVQEIGQAFPELEKDENLRSIILTGAGEKIFSAGADLGSGFGGDVDALINGFHTSLLKIERCSKPVIAALNGHAFGGGCEISLACHFRILKKTARIGLTESNLGIIPGAGGTQRMPRVIGRAKALEYMIFGKQVPADEALAVGLVTALSEEGKVLDDAKEFARRLAERAPLATKFLIDCVSRGMEAPIEDALYKIEKGNFMQVVKTSDAAEGIQAFFQKRKAEFKGK